MPTQSCVGCTAPDSRKANNSVANVGVVWYHIAMKQNQAVCKQCGKPMPKRPPCHAGKFCSRECAWEAKKKTLTPKTCAVCGCQWMPTNTTQAKRNKTCSWECAKKMLAQAPRKRKPLPICQQCGKEFKPKGRAYGKAKFCDRKCSAAHRMAQPGELERVKKIAATGRNGWTEESRASYLENMTGEKNPAWKGGVTFMRKHGNYKPIKYVRCPAEFLPMARKDGYVMEHRLIVAQRLGRCLSRTEVVHHVNHDPQDNRPENLELFPDNRTHKTAEGARNAAG